ncbi:MAG: phage portal protein, partial [Oscillospiraceae bacterium]
KPVLWEIGCITAGENNALRGSCLKPGRGGDLQFDTGWYQAKLCARCTRFPPLGDAELQDSYGVQTAEDLLLTMLTPGEFEDYAQRVLEINGFQSEREMAEEAKN